MSLRHSLGLLTLASIGAGSATAQWAKQATLPSPNGVMALAVISPHEVFGASANTFGAAGDIVHTVDGGRQWQVTSLPTNSLWSLYFVDPLHGWAAGNGFFHTVDGGRTWVQDNNWGSIYDIFFLDTQRGWACGNGSVTYRTLDGGLSWSAVSAPGGTTMSSIWFVDRLLGFAVGIGGTIVRSIDGGQSWSLVHSNSSAYLSTIQFFDALEGWAIGGDAFLHTRDGGQTWVPAAVPANTWSHGARFRDRRNGISVGEAGNVVVTHDGGATWREVRPQGSGVRLWDVEYADDAVALFSGERGTIGVSYDGGDNWTTLQSGAGGITYDLHALDVRRAFGAHDFGEIVLTTDGGRRWERIGVAGFDEFGALKGVGFADARVGWACGVERLFQGDVGIVSGSTDGGRTWREQVRVPNFEYRGIAAIDATHAFVVGASLPAGPQFASVLRTTDGGTSWQQVGPPGASLRGVHFRDANTGWAVGRDIWRTDDAGQTWTQQMRAGAEFTDVDFADANVGWAVGFASQVVRTTDGGATWTVQNPHTPAPLTAIEAISVVDGSTAVIAGWNGFFARTTDGGQTWLAETIPGTQGVDLHSAAFLDVDTGWVGGNVGIWQRMASGAATAAFRTFGASCSGASLAGDPTRPPVLGTSLRTTLHNAPPGAPSAFMLGSSFRSWGSVPLPLDLTVLGMTNCRVWVAPDVILALANPTGTVTLSIPLPAQLSLVGRSLLEQAVVVDPTANAAGVALTSGLEAWLGTR
ncbi:MAG: YCF48-related protein [Planctomycetota bacterium]